MSKSPKLSTSFAAEFIGLWLESDEPKATPPDDFGTTNSWENGLELEVFVLP